LVPTIRNRAGVAVAPSHKDSDAGRGEISPADREAFRKRADELGHRLESARGQAKSHDGTRPATSSASGDAMARAMRISAELIGGVLVGSVLGWALDKWLGTWPMFFILFFLLGSAAGMLNVVRSAMKEKTGPSNPNAGPSVRDDDETN
jgi:ATP synthase protein I